MSEKENILLISPLQKGTLIKEEGMVDDYEVPDPSSKNPKVPNPSSKNPKVIQKVSGTAQPGQAKSKVPVPAGTDSEIADDYEGSDVDDIRTEFIDQNINAVAALKAYFLNEKKNGNVYRDDEMKNLENNLEDQVQEVLDEKNMWDPSEYRIKYQAAIKSYQDPKYTDLVSHILKDLLNVEGVTSEIKNGIKGVIKSMRVEIDPVGVSDISEAGWDYLSEVFESFGGYAYEQLTGDILNTSGDDCFSSHPYVTAFALLSGTSSGLFTKGPLWARILKGAALPIKGPISLGIAADKALARTVDRLPFFIGTASKVTRYGVYGAILAGATAAPAAALALPDDADELNKLRDFVKQKVESLIGDIPIGFLPSALEDIIGGLIVDNSKSATGGTFGVPKSKANKIAKKFVDKNSKNIENAIKDGATDWTQKQIDALTAQIPLTGKEMKDLVSSEVINKINAAAKMTEADRGHMNSMNCYLLMIGGAFALANLARAPLKSAGFDGMKALAMMKNQLTNKIAEQYKAFRRAKGGFFKLKSGNDLAAYLALKSIIENPTVSRQLGEVRISQNLTDKPTLMIYGTGPSGVGAVVNNKVIRFNTRHIPDVHRKKFKAFTKEVTARDGTKLEIIEINISKANQQLRDDVSIPVFESVQTELSKEIKGAYRTGVAMNRIRKLASHVDSLNMRPAALMDQHYKNTATMITKMMERTKNNSKVFERALTEIERRSKRLRGALANTFISPDEVIDAVKKYEKQNPTGPKPNFRLIAKHLPPTVRIDKTLRAALGRSTRTKYDNLIDDILVLDALEKQMVTEFKMIDEMYQLERKMHKKFKGTRALDDIPPNFDAYIRAEVGIGDKLLKYSRNIAILYEQFKSYLNSRSVIVNLNRRISSAERKAVDATIQLAGEAVWAAQKLGPALMNVLRSVNLRNINEAFKNDPKLFAFLAVSSPGLYDFIDAIIDYLSRVVNENVADLSNDDRVMFVEFLNGFVVKTRRRRRNGKKDDKWVAWLRDFKSIGAGPVNPDKKDITSAKQKMATLFKLFQDMKNQGQDDTVKENRIITMKKTDLRKLVSEVLNENTGMGYSKYPYHAEEYSEAEPDEDYMSEWKMLVDEVCGRKKKNVDGDPSTVEDTAVEVAKLLIKDSDLFREVLELAGSNKSVGTEIMKQLKVVKDKSMIDNNSKV